jgi:hypothetical protein
VIVSSSIPAFTFFRTNLLPPHSPFLFFLLHHFSITHFRSFFDLKCVSIAVDHFYAFFVTIDSVALFFLVFRVKLIVVFVRFELNLRVKSLPFDSLFLIQHL